MNQTAPALTLGLVSVTLLAVACAPATVPASVDLPSVTVSLAGTYDCGPEGEAPEDVVELKADGTLTITHPDGVVEEGTWTAEGNSGAFGPGTEFEDPFTIEGANLVFADPGAALRFVCTPAA